ncbi:MAG: hypothetical protein ACRDLB_12390 [Actinomycetota bacterium]
MKKSLVLMAASAIIVAGFSTPGVAKRFAQTETLTQECTNALGMATGSVVYEGPTELWPPNHKYVPATVTFIDEDSDPAAGDDLMAEFMAGHDQIIDGEEINGAGNTDEDITPAVGMPSGTGTVVQDFLIRGERSGRVKEGRNYTIAGAVEFSDSNMNASSVDTEACMFSFTIHVPHDQGNGND